MLRKYFIPLLALLGALLGLWTVYKSQKTLPVPPILFAPASSPYAHSIAGAGIIEASSQNIAVGSPFDEIIEKIFVREGDQIKKGDPLFQLDLRNFEAQLALAEAQLQVSEANFADKKTQFSFYSRLKDTRAVSEQVFQQASYALVEAEENLKVGRANVEVAKINIERSLVRSPIDGTVLQLNIHIGEIAPIIPVGSSQSLWLTATQGCLMLIGSVDPLQVRVNVDEDDAWRFEKGSAATAFVRGNSRIHFPIKFVRLEPYMIPKASFTGATTERVDTRVLQVLYNFDKEDLPVYPGQVLDIFIESRNLFSHHDQVLNDTTADRG